MMIFLPVLAAAAVFFPEVQLISGDDALSAPRQTAAHHL